MRKVKKIYHHLQHRLQKPCESFHKFWTPQRTQVLIFILLFGIFCFGSFFRFYRLPERYPWWGDIGRDLLVSKHIWRYQENISIGHAASGLKDGSCGIRSYPSYYYNYLAVLWSLTQQMGGVIGVTVIWNCLAIIFCYLLVSTIHNRISGLFAALLFAVSYEFISEAPVIVGLQVAIPFCILGALLVVVSLYKQKRLLNILALLFLIFLSTFHYSVLILIGALFIISEAVFMKKDKKLSVQKSLGIGVGYGVFFLLLHYAVIRECGGLPQFFSMFVGGGSSQNLGSGLGSVPQLFYNQLRLVFPVWNFASVMTIIVLAVVAVFTARRSRGPIGSTVGIILLFLFGSAIFSSQGMGMQMLQTLYIRYIFYFLATLSMGYVFEETVRRRWYLLTGVVILAAILLVASTSYRFSFLKWGSSEEPTKNLAKFLWQKNEHYPFSAVLYREGSMQYDSAVLAFWLEEVSGQKLYVATDRYENYVHLDPNPPYKIFACDVEENPSDVHCVGPLVQFRKENNAYVTQENILKTEDGRFHIHIFKKLPE